MSLWSNFGIVGISSILRDLNNLEVFDATNNFLSSLDFRCYMGFFRRCRASRRNWARQRLRFRRETIETSKNACWSPSTTTASYDPRTLRRWRPPLRELIGKSSCLVYANAAGLIAFPGSSASNPLLQHVSSPAPLADLS
jgi:hypothetical protein